MVFSRASYMAREKREIKVLGKLASCTLASFARGTHPVGTQGTWGTLMRGKCPPLLANCLRRWQRWLSSSSLPEL